MDKKVKIVNSVPAIVSDGHGLGVNIEGNAANLIFIQITPPQGASQEEIAALEEIDGNMVANIRMSLEQLEKLGSDINKITEESKAKAAEKK